MRHCPPCAVEWNAIGANDNNCWVCGRVGEFGPDKSAKWSSAMTASFRHWEAKGTAA